MSGTGTGVRYSGLGLAALAFAVTRLLVAGTLEPDAISFMVAGVVPLIAGLGLCLFGVALAVGAFSPSYARSVWLWSVVGTVAMGVVLSTTAVHSILVGRGMEPLLESGPLVGNAILGGAIAGAVVGDRTARSRRRQEDLAQYAERATLVNRLLRHEITNAATVLKGYADRLDDGDEPAAAVRDAADRIETTVGQIGEFASADHGRTAVDLDRVLSDAATALPDHATLSIERTGSEDAHVFADRRLAVLVGQLLETASEHAGPDGTVEVALDADDDRVTLRVGGDGPGLDESTVQMLETPGLPEHDDPRVDYGLQMVRLLADQYDADVAVDSDDHASITVTFARAAGEGAAGVDDGVAVATLTKAGTAGLVAGVAMGLAMAVLGGRVPTIGALYSVDSVAVGWITHLFHSALFGLLFATVLETRRLGQYATTVWRRSALGVAWGVLLWVVATGLVMPLWLATADVPAPIPNLSAVELLLHVLWGALLGRLSTTDSEIDAVGDWLQERLGPA